MAITSRATNKTNFASGTAATGDKFVNLFDSMYSKYDDSVMLGPVGVSGLYGLIGPTGGTHYGVYPSGGSAPTGSSASGYTGQFIVAATGGTVFGYFHDGVQWYRFAGATF